MNRCYVVRYFVDDDADCLLAVFTEPAKARECALSHGDDKPDVEAVELNPEGENIPDSAAMGQCSDCGQYLEIVRDEWPGGAGKSLHFCRTCAKKR